MASRLAMQVLESNLDPYLKPTAVAMALFADVDGNRIFPSINRVMWLLGVQRSTVRAHLKKLRELGVLVAVTPLTGGRNKATRYRMTIPPALSRPRWTPAPKGPTGEPVSVSLKGPTDEPVSLKGPTGEPVLTERGRLEIERGRFDEKGADGTRERGRPIGPDQEEILHIDQGEEIAPTTARESFLEKLRKSHPELAQSFEHIRTRSENDGQKSARRSMGMHRKSNGHGRRDTE